MTLTFSDCYTYTFKHHWKYQAQAKTTRMNYQNIVGVSRPVSDLSSGAWWTELVTHLKDQGLAPSTIHKVIAVATFAVNFTRKAGLHSVNIPEFSRPKLTKKRRPHFTREEVAALVSHSSVNLADAILVSAYTGIRQDELLSLTPEAIEDNGIHVVDSKGDDRFVPMHPEVATIINRRLTNTRLFGDNWLNSDQLYGAFVKARTAAGLSNKKVWHSLRHSFGTWLAEKASVQQIKDLMGHKSILTSQIYIHSNPELNRSAVSCL